MFVKPTNMGGGSGIDSFSVVHNNYQLNSKIASISHEYMVDSLVEQFLPGREFSVAVMYDNTDGVLHTMPLEIVAPQNIDGDRVLSAEIKNADTEKTLAVIEGKLRDSITALALSVFSALGARDYGRIDIRLDANGVPNFLEANLIPSLIEKYGNFPKACIMNRGLGFEEMIIKITELALSRAPEFSIKVTQS
jgi:D-alanine-D-alanine ligase